MPENTTITLVSQDLTLNFSAILPTLGLSPQSSHELSDVDRKTSQAWQYSLAPSSLLANDSRSLQQKMQQQLAEQQLPLDFCLHSHRPDTRETSSAYGLACFDMDSTLIQCEVIDELAGQAGVKEQVAAITEQAMNGEIDFNQSFRQRLGLLKGLDEKVVQTVIEQLPYSPGLANLLLTLKKHGITTAILSGGFIPFAQHLKEQFSVDHILANALSSENGKLTGQVSGNIVNAQAKADTLRQLAQAQELAPSQTIAAGDGANDLPMIASAGFGVAYRAKPIVRQQAPHNIIHGGLDTLLYYLGIPQSQWA